MTANCLLCVCLCCALLWVLCHREGLFLSPRCVYLLSFWLYLQSFNFFGPTLLSKFHLFFTKCHLLLLQHCSQNFDCNFWNFVLFMKFLHFFNRLNSQNFHLKLQMKTPSCIFSWCGPYSLPHQTEYQPAVIFFKGESRDSLLVTTVLLHPSPTWSTLGHLFVSNTTPTWQVDAARAAARAAAHHQATSQDKLWNQWLDKKEPQQHDNMISSQL